ncbi:Uncharacterised protein [Mycobacteroides abscessus subsp. abscessus]|nr:Uncharacterised protein [Mycobacteroides abscessus subsp. abscessus]
MAISASINAASTALAPLGEHRWMLASVASLTGRMDSSSSTNRSRDGV